MENMSKPAAIGIWSEEIKKIKGAYDPLSERLRTPVCFVRIMANNT
jgi:hypothetical protein